MSTSIGTYTYCVAAAALQRTFATEGDFDALSIEKAASESEIAYVFGDSRNGWASHALDRLLRAFGANHLRFLLADDYRHRVPVGHGMFRQLQAIEDKARIDAAIAEMAELFEWSLRNVELVGDLSGTYAYDEIPPIVLATGAARIPRLDRSIHRDEEGDDIGYLYAYLRSVAKVLEYASRNGLAFVHDQEGGYAEGEDPLRD
ncbi:MAG TPA: hypothetical protein VFK48_14475 [Usitatibacter sp.]|nr:hypothetical protein [Usitatibacter sp.]